MLPSESDMAAVRPVLIFLGIAAAVVLIVTGIPAIPPSVVDTVNAIAGYLAAAFGLTLAVDLVFMAVIGLLLVVTRWLQGYW
jgi:NAD/NADP transhydrogenase beta subunit